MPRAWDGLDDAEIADDKRFREARKDVREAEKILRDARKQERAAAREARERARRVLSRVSTAPGFTCAPRVYTSRALVVQWRSALRVFCVAHGVSLTGDGEDEAWPSCLMCAS